MGVCGKIEERMRDALDSLVRNIIPSARNDCQPTHVARRVDGSEVRDQNALNNDIQVLLGLLGLFNKPHEIVAL